MRELNELAKHGKDLGRLLSDLLNHFRNLLIYQISKGDLKLLEVSEIEAAALAEETKLIATDVLTRVMEVFTDAEGRLRDAASKKIFVEVTLLKAIQARNSVSLDAVLQQLQQLRASEGGGTSSAAPMVTARPAAAPQPQSDESRTAATVAPRAATVPAAAGTEAPAGSGAQLEELWRNVLEALGRVSAFTRSYFIDARAVSLVKNVLTIGFDPEFKDQIDLVNNTKTIAILQTKLQELGHPNTQIKFVVSENAPPRDVGLEAAPAPVAVPTPAAKSATPPAARPKTEKPAAPAVNAEEFKNDPLIQKALEIFKGQIVEVRA